MQPRKLEQNKNIWSELLMQHLPPLTRKGELSSQASLRNRNQQKDTSEATFSEVFSDTVVDAAATGFICAHLETADKPILWIQDRLSRREAGKPYLAGLPAPLKIIYVNVSKPIDVLWAMEEGLRCTGLSAVLGEVWGDPPCLDFTASKRLALRAEARRLPAWLIRRAATPNLSAARMRWRVSSLASETVKYDMRAPGHPLWRAELFRARWRAPGEWVASHTEAGLTFSHGVQDTPSNLQTA